MKIKMRTEKFIYITLYVLALLFLLIYGLESLENSLFYLNIALGIIIVGVAQFSLFTVIAVISNYMLANVYLVYKTGSGYGLLAMTSDIYMKEMNILLLMFNLSILFWILNKTILIKERNFIKTDFNISKQTCNILAVLAVILAYIAFPSFQFGLTESRFQSLLPGHFWNHFMVIFMIFAASKIKESNFIKICIFVITVWVLLHGERVDILGFYTFLLIKYCVKKDYKINGKFFARYGVALVFFFSLLVFIGEKRVGGSYVTEISSFITSFLSQGTASDVGYVFNSSIDYVLNNKLLYGRTYITYIQGIIPFLDQPFRSGKIIQNLYRTAGGEYILVEPLINFGFMGVLCAINMMIAFVNIFLKKTTAYMCIVYLFIIATSFRFTWYGLTYIETGILYLIPITYLFTWIIGRKPKISRNDWSLQ